MLQVFISYVGNVIKVMRMKFNIFETEECRLFKAKGGLF